MASFKPLGSAFLMLVIMLLYPWPHSLHQLMKHGRLHPEVVEGLWVI